MNFSFLGAKYQFLPKTESKLPSLLGAGCAFGRFFLFRGPLTGLPAEHHSAVCILPYNNLSFQQSFNM